MPDNLQTNGNVFTFILDFEPSLLKFYNKLTGREMRPVLKDVDNGDGTISKMWVAEAVVDNADLALVNDMGAKFIMHELDYYYNPQIAMAKLSQDNCVDIASDAIDAIFDEIFLNWNLYKHINKDGNETSASRLHAEEQNMLNGLYMWLKALEDGGVSQWGRDVISIKQSEQQQANQQGSGNDLLQNFNAKLHK